MNTINKMLLGAIVMMAASCTKYEPLDNYSVDKPESIEAQEAIDAYPALKTYINRTAHPNFKFGTATEISNYINRGVKYRLVNRNFDEIALGYEMKHGGVVQDNGALALDNVNKLLATAQQAGITVYGHTLCWHANQNAKYLKSLIAPQVIPGSGPSWDVVSANNFETSDAANYTSNGNATRSFTAAGGGANGQGRALMVTNASVRGNDWESQFFFTFSPAAKEGEQYELSMDVRADVPATFGTQAHTVPYAYKHWDFFGSIAATTTWTKYTKQITISANTATCGAIAFNLGKTATNFYFDNITVKKYNAMGGSTTVEKTPAQKDTIINKAMEQWISVMVTNCKSYVKAWDVVNEPMDDGKPYELKTGIGRTDLTADNFYWQDYMGKDYAVKAFKLARQYGNAGDLLFINDYNLEYNLDKCRGLIEYVKYIESKGAKVDGIGSQMHVSINTDKDKIAEMFKLLVATGKQIKVSELDISVGVKTTEATADHYQKQAEMYKYIIDKYFELVPAAQRYGLTIWSPLDSPVSSSWIPGQPIGIWTEGYVRKLAYSYVAEALKANTK